MADILSFHNRLGISRHITEEIVNIEWEVLAHPKEAYNEIHCEDEETVKTSVRK